MDEVLEKIGELGIVPVVKIDRPEDAIPLGRSLIEGDLPVAEITFRTAAAESAIKNLNRELPELLVGAGTVLSVEQVKKAISAGARFIVSPGFNPKVVDFCVENGIPITPGLNNPTQIEMALERGLEVVKFFPAEPSGGIELLKAMAAPYSGIKFIPTGGINKENLNSYLSYDRVHACGGSWMVKAELISSSRFDEITRLTREAVSTILGFEFSHLGINEGSPEKAIESATFISNAFRLPLKESETSISTGSWFEITKGPLSENKGYIAICTNNIHRAIAYLNRKGISVLPKSAKEKNGKLNAVHLGREVSGFAIHLVQKSG
jgi:2-dehydro-3-deoxyphosphogluconate aldolase/(4S)-4-hydroxy-2-oxoglutarate aldolase